MISDGISSVDEKVISFLMIGQSNMAGRGDLAEVEAIDNASCLMLRMGRWQKMSEPINPDRGVWAAFQPGVSLAASFADCAAKKFSAKIGLIPCADGGTSIAQWQPGEVLFDHAVLMTELAKRNSVLGGILWHQGEEDCKVFDAEYYRNSFLNTMTTLRKKLCAEKVPLIIGELSENISEEKWKLGDKPARMNQLLHELVREVPYCEIASSKGLKLRTDGIHFGAASCRELGRRYFEKYLLARQKIDSENRGAFV